MADKAAEEKHGRRRRKQSTEDKIAGMCKCTSGEHGDLAPIMSTCVNCRAAVEAAQARAYVRKLRSIKRRSECTSSKCISFIESVEDDALRAHFTAMAWWRFSLNPDDSGTKKLYRMMRSAPAPDLVMCDEYMHKAMRELARCTPSQVLTWFGHETPYQAVMFYSGRDRSCRGAHCEKCAMLTRGCPQADTSAASSCNLWEDKVLQNTLSGVAQVSADPDDIDDEVETTDDGEIDDGHENAAENVQAGCTACAGSYCDDPEPDDGPDCSEIELAY